MYVCEDPTAGPSASDQSTWYLDESTLSDNIKKTLHKFCGPSPVVFRYTLLGSHNGPPCISWNRLRCSTKTLLVLHLQIWISYQWICQISWKILSNLLIGPWNINITLPCVWIESRIKNKNSPLGNIFPYYNQIFAFLLFCSASLSLLSLFLLVAI